MAPPIPTADFLRAVQYRRTVYPLTDTSPISADRLEEVVREVVSIAPSAYNTQPMRTAIFIGAEHKKFWQIIREVSLPVLAGAGEEVVTMMKSRFDMFEAAWGSVTFWERTSTVSESAQKHAAAGHMFPQWSEHELSTMKCERHAPDPGVDSRRARRVGRESATFEYDSSSRNRIKKEFGIEDDWSLKAHLNVGGLTGDLPQRPEKLPFTDTIKVFKS